MTERPAQSGLYEIRGGAYNNAPGGLGQVLDLSGNVKEWTDTERPAQSGLYEIRGGAYNNAPGGLTCDFDFTLASANFNFQNLGFRCCYYE